MIMGAMLQANAVDAEVVKDRYFPNALVACQDTSFRYVPVLLFRVLLLTCAFV
jgi:hypothetical protein